MSQQLESEAHNRGKILVKLDGESGELVWHTWGHCTVKAAVAASIRSTLSQRLNRQRPREETASEQLGPHAKKPTTIENLFGRVLGPAAGGARSAAPRAAAAAAGASSSAAPRAAAEAAGGVSSLDAPRAPPRPWALLPEAQAYLLPRLAASARRRAQLLLTCHGCLASSANASSNASLSPKEFVRHAAQLTKARSIEGLTVRGDGFGWANDRDTLKLTPSVDEEQAEGCRPRKGRWRGGGEVTSHAGVLRTTVKGWTKGHVACEG